jgi:predicted dehydrogenase
MRSLQRMLAELAEVAREGSFSGMIRYVRFKTMPAAEHVVERRSTCQRGVAVVGAGTHTASVLLPSLSWHAQPVYAITSKSLSSARKLARLYDIPRVVDSLELMLEDERCSAFVVATPHHMHPQHIIAVLRSDRYVYCEKPVAIDEEGVQQLEREGSTHSAAHKVMIGFNRRFAPAIRALRKETWIRERKTPLELHYRVNFGPRVANAMSDPAVGGGRLIGAACHYVDLMSYLAGSPIVSVAAVSPEVSGVLDENTFAAAFALRDGSIGSLSFTSDGSRLYEPKEELAVTCGGHVARINDFSEIRIDSRRSTFWRHRYGSVSAMGAFLESCHQRRPVPVTLQDGIHATRVTLAMRTSIRSGGERVDVR